MAPWRATLLQKKQSGRRVACRQPCRYVVKVQGGVQQYCKQQMGGGGGVPNPRCHKLGVHNAG